jgi:hypothetical protein
MGTKENPGQIDCYGAAAPDEPIFVLRASDELAPIVVRVWAELYKGVKRDLTPKQAMKFSEAHTCAAAMERYREKKRG